MAATSFYVAVLDYGVTATTGSVGFAPAGYVVPGPYATPTVPTTGQIWPRGNAP